MAGSPGVGELLLGPRRGQWKGGVAFKWRSATGGAVGDQFHAWWFETRGLCRHHSGVEQGTGNLFYLFFWGGRKGFLMSEAKKKQQFSFFRCGFKTVVLILIVGEIMKLWPGTDGLGILWPTAPLAAIWGIVDVGIVKPGIFASFLSESVASHFDHSHTWWVSSFRHFKILRAFFLVRLSKLASGLYFVSRHFLK